MTGGGRADVVVIGGGVIGCATALALREAGVEVLVVEQHTPGAEASSAAAGILGAQAEAREPGPFADLAHLSLQRYPALAARLCEVTGIDVELRRSGITALGFGDEQDALQAQAAWQRSRGHEVIELDAGGLARLEPRLAPGATYGVHFPNDARVDPPSLVRALHLSAESAGARFRTGAAVSCIRRSGGAVQGVDLADGSSLSCGAAVVTAGSWSALIAGAPDEAATVEPVRGQLVELRAQEPPLGGVVFGPKCYLVPRDDGRVLVGSTLEFVGHERKVTAGAVRDLLAAATALVPDLARATFSRAWSNFRPYSTRGVPLIGRTRTAGLLLATGHHRNGILLAPITAAIVQALVTRQEPPLNLDAFSPLAAPTSG